MNLKSITHRLPASPGRRYVLLGVAALLLIVLIVAVATPRDSAASTGFHEVRRGTFTVSIVEAGNLAAVSEVSIRSEVEGTARIIYIVPEGSFVHRGDMIVELDSAQAEDQVNQQLINFEKAQFGLIQAQEQLSIQRSATQSDISAAELKVRFADLDLEKFFQGQRDVDLIESSNRVVQAENQLAIALENYNWTTNLAAKGYETQQKVDSDRLAVLNQRNALIVATNTLWLLQQFDLRKLQEQYESSLDEARKELDRVVAQSRARIAQSQADLLTQSNTLILNQRKLERDRRNLEATKIHAPQDGLVVYAVSENRFSSESLIEEGAVVRNRQEIIKLPDTSRMKVTVKVHESHINMIRAGLPAFVILDSMPDTRFAAYVERVGLLPDTQSRWGNPNLKVYNTDVHITDPLPDVKPGVSARAEIIVTNIANALSVPIQSVTTHRGRQVVYVLNRGTPEPRPVEPGMYNTRFIQILSGLNEGDRVLLAPPFDSQERDLEGSVLTPDERAALTNAPARPDSRPRPAPGESTAIPGAPGSSLAARPGIPGANPGAPTTPGAAGPGAPGAPGAPGGADFQALIRQYDRDGDGQLNDEEREAMRAAMAARFAGQAQPRGADAQAAQGPGSAQGPGAGQGGPRFNREEMLRQFDKDGDGELNEEERAAMRQALGGGRNREGGGGGGGGFGGGGAGPREGGGGGRPGGRAERPPE
ncbi:MAG: efflux RND transporter periplasmic adaptor subunit [Verrucomicrobiae bacterium]|nr:efflux RND transporter periplasmic adaptor subunit [Verrucomicrobiae bacterium]